MTAYTLRGLVCQGAKTLRQLLHDIPAESWLENGKQSKIEKHRVAGELRNILSSKILQVKSVL